jgi:hypothetical protein
MSWDKGHCVMSWQPGDDKRYRDRADELRARADMFSPENRMMLLNMADFYDGFAREAEKKILALDPRKNSN